MKGWRPMASAPKDGTPILVCETPNGEQYNVLAAAHIKINGMTEADWWGVYPRTDNHILETKYFSAIACTPICWKPFPKPEDKDKLRRRHSQLLRYKYPKEEAQPCPNNNNNNNS
jgi:hypothetical protein